MKINKKASALSIIAWVTGTIVIVFFLAGYAYGFNQITTALTAIPATSNIVNISQAAINVFVPINQAMNYLTYISFILIIMLGLSILIENYYIKRHPIMFVIHFFITVSSVIGAIYISNSYETMMNNSVLASYIQAHVGSSWIILNLPYVTAILGIIGLIIMLTNFSRDPELRSSAL